MQKNGVWSGWWIGGRRCGSMAVLAGVIGLGLTTVGCGGNGETTPLPEAGAAGASGTNSAKEAPPPTAPTATEAEAVKPPTETPKHLTDAMDFVHDIGPYSTLYVKGGRKVIWPGIKGGPMCRTDCSGFVNELLTNSLGYSEDDFKPWFGSGRPLAKDWYAAISAGRGFATLAKVGDLYPGDFLAVQYPAGGEVTGHCMLIVEKPRAREASEPVIEGTTQYEVLVIDASKSPHGEGDSRYKAMKPRPPKDPNEIMQVDTTIEPIEGPPAGSEPVDASGLGQGTLRLYVDKEGRIAGYAWSRSKESKFKSAAEYKIAAGRLQAGFDPKKQPATAGATDPDAGD